MDYTTIIDTTTSSQSSAVFYGLMGAASGFIYSVIVLQAVTSNDYNTSRGYAQFVGGLVLGFTCLASGIAVGIVGKNGLHAISENKSSPVRLVLNLIYCEALGLYGLIFAIIAASSF